MWIIPKAVFALTIDLALVAGAQGAGGQLRWLGVYVDDL